MEMCMEMCMDERTDMHLQTHKHVYRQVDRHDDHHHEHSRRGGSGSDLPSAHGMCEHCGRKIGNADGDAEDHGEDCIVALTRHLSVEARCDEECPDPLFTKISDHTDGGRRGAWHDS